MKPGLLKREKDPMTINTEIEYDKDCGLDYEAIASDIVKAALIHEDCPFECELSLLVTDDASIEELNSEFRHMEKSTDVLSFPMAEFEVPADFSGMEEDVTLFDPDTGEFLLGDIVISMDHVISQAELYGHSRKREFAFLIAHSMLHLMGYDHMDEEERKEMERRQEEILASCGYTRDMI